MTFFFYCPWHDRDQWLSKLNKKFKNEKIVTLQDNPDFSTIKYAIVWELPDKIYKKLISLKLIFSLGAGVDHILNLPSYNNVPIVRLKDPLMGQRMSNHVISQILQYQLNLKYYMKSQKKNIWENFKEPVQNSNITVGVLGLGFLGSYVAQNLLTLGYKVQGYKITKPKKKFKFPVFFEKKYLKKFIKNSDILVSILPATPQTNNLINKNFLQQMKKKSLLINVGRGSSIKEKDLVSNLKTNKSFYASLDVFVTEPLPKKHPFWNLSNVTITPHVASVTAIDSAINHIYRKFNEFKKNKKIKNDVDLKKGY